MHTATRLAVPVIRRTHKLNPTAHLCAYGLYAPVNAEMLRKLGVRTLAGGEFEEALLTLVRPGRAPLISLARQQFLTPDRSGLPPLSQYAQLVLPGGARRTVGYTESSRGCKHLCRHCPVVPVYQGHFRIVQRGIVLDDIRQQVATGAQHITFGDPDFFNGIGHAVALVRALHREFPHVTYDATIKVEHLLGHCEHLPLLRETGCAFVVSAVESVDDYVLQHILEKGHTRADFVRVAHLFRELGLVLAPTFIPFHPWMSLGGYAGLLATIAELDLVEHVSPVQLSDPFAGPGGIASAGAASKRAQPSANSMRCTELSLGASGIREWIRLQREELEAAIASAVTAKEDRRAIFRRAWEMTHRAMAKQAPRLPDVPPGRPRVTIPYLTEPWYC